MTKRIQIIDSHTGGEPTRVVISGFPDLGGGALKERLEKFKNEYDHYRSAIVNEPRGSDVIVGALLCEPVDKSCAAGVIFFNNVSYLGMCGHGTIGLVVTLKYMNRIGAGEHKIETPVGTITAHLNESGEVTVDNVPSYRLAKDVEVNVDGIGTIKGDIAWGGNWFFLINEHRQDLNLANVESLTEYTWRIRQALTKQNITGANGQEIDHIEIFSSSEKADSKNFVLCPGKAYDRSPCGTGTSAKLACLFADGKLEEGEIYKQESIVGSVFAGSVRIADDKIFPSIKGTAFVISAATLILDESHPLCWGISYESSLEPAISLHPNVL